MSADGKCARLHLSTLSASRGPGGVDGAGSWPWWSWNQTVGVGSSALSLCNAEVVGMKFGLVELVSLSFSLSLPVKGLPP